MFDSIRCPGCRKKLAEDLDGKLTVMCPRCKKTHTFDSSIGGHPGWGAYVPHDAMPAPDAVTITEDRQSST